MFANIKRIKASNYSSLFALISITMLSAVIQTSYPSILLVASTETFVLLIAYINLLKDKILKNEELKKVENNGRS